MDRLWTTNRDYCMLVLRLAAGAMFLAHGSRLITHIALSHGPALPLAGAALEVVGALGLLAGLLARLSAGALLCDVAAGLIAFGNSAPGRGAVFYVLAGVVFWSVIIHGAGPYSVDSWLTRHVAVKRV